MLRFISLFVIILLNSSYIFSKNLIDSIEFINPDILSISKDGEGRYIKIEPKLEPLEERWVSINLSSFLSKSVSIDIFLIGEMDNLASFIISQFTTKGNKKKQDWLELYCTKSGFTGGISVFYNNNYFVLENNFAKEGDRLVYEFENGLSNNNGYIEIRSTKSIYSRVIDKVIYTDGKKKFDKTLCNDDWQSEGFNVTGSSTKKVIKRKKDNKSNYIDTNTKDDFFIE